MRLLLVYWRPPPHGRWAVIIGQLVFIPVMLEAPRSQAPAEYIHCHEFNVYIASVKGVKSMYKQDMIYTHRCIIICLLRSLPEEVKGKPC